MRTGNRTIMDVLSAEGRYFEKDTNTGNCLSCELARGDSCCNGLWNKINSSATWKTWIKNAKKIIEFIEKRG